MSTDLEPAREAIDGEPRPEVPSWQTLDPNSLIVSRLAGAVTTAILAVLQLVGVVGVLLSDDRSWLTVLVAVGGGLGLVLTAGLLSWVIPARRYRYTRYRLDSQGLLICRGRLFRSEVAVLRSRIQHTDVTQGPIERAFGLGTLVIHTAGTARAEIQLSGIAWEEARRLRSELTALESDHAV
jgi:membrane protein YdbS with pleckstrin-like domain